MSVRAAILTALLCLAGSRLFSAEDALQAIHGTCTIAPSTMPDHVRYEFRARRLRERRRRSTATRTIPTRR